LANAQLEAPQGAGQGVGMTRIKKIIVLGLTFATFAFAAGAVTTACVPAPTGGGGTGGGGGGGGRVCCRYCTTGKPCGNTCIARHLTCRTPGGCACFGNNVDPETEAEWLAAMEPDAQPFLGPAALR